MSPYLPHWRERHTPKLLICLREGYDLRKFLGDLGAGLTVAVIALPLAMALGIASIPQAIAQQLAAEHPWMTPPAMGLFTAVIAGFLISAFGGSRVQIGGPTAAFMPLVFAISTAHGYGGLALATCMAGVMLILLGVFRFGGVIRFVPYPVTAGFTAGIGVVILASQIKDFFGLTLVGGDGKALLVPAEFLGKIELFAAHAETWNWRATSLAVGSLLVLAVLRRVAPKLPGAVVAIALSALVVHFCGWAGATETLPSGATRALVDTIGSRFGGIPSSLPAPQLPPFSIELVRELFPSAAAIAFLGAIESLLSAVVADGMTGYRHRSDQELVGQGLANLAAAVFCGLPATGAIARTAANVRSGGRTPIAGMLHAGFVLVFMLALAPIASLIPLPSLAAILVMVAWKVSELEHFRSLLRAPKPDVLVLLTTFGLTVLFDLVIAVGTGILLASILFMRRMAQVSTVSGLVEEGFGEPGQNEPERRLPAGLAVYEINGPFFFGVANSLRDALDRVEVMPRLVILRMRFVPHVDATGLDALKRFHERCREKGMRLLLSGVHEGPRREMERAGLVDAIGREHVLPNFDRALAHANALLAKS
ncbi:MAG: STAS domain-containing protein [Planctomycetes bacterium]|nr:STAS domain-containing protein [Planctomycetota bacterium]